MREILFWITTVGTAATAVLNFYMLCKEEKEDDDV